MRLPHAAIVLCSVAVVGYAQEATGPFGLHRGMAKDEVVKLVGKDAVKKTEGILGQPPSRAEKVELLTVPRPHAAFESFTLMFSAKDGLLKIIAYGKDIRTNGFGEAVRTSFDELRDAVSQTYGKPGKSIDFVRTGSIWHEPEDFMMGLLKEERNLAVMWDTALPNSIHAIVLEANALSRDKGYLTLTYEFQGWGEFVDEMKKKANTVF
jgi:hypothetical protein